MNYLKVFSIGKIVKEKEKVKIIIEQKYADGLKGLEDYSHAQIIWWMDKADRTVLAEEKPYKCGPDEIGVFALRSPERPNPVAVSSVSIKRIDISLATIELYYIDAFNNSDVIDIKPYTPSIDRIEKPITPNWCAHWPKSYGESASFNWKDEFNSDHGT